MWRFTRNNDITEGFHNKMELINRQAYGFPNFQNYKLRVRVLWFSETSLGSGFATIVGVEPAAFCLEPLILLVAEVGVGLRSRVEPT